MNFTRIDTRLLVFANGHNRVDPQNLCGKPPMSADPGEARIRTP